MAEASFEYLLQVICILPDRWNSLPPAKVAEAKLAKMGRALHRLAHDAFINQTVGSFPIDLDIRDGRTDIPGRSRPLYRYLLGAAIQLETFLASESGSNKRSGVRPKTLSSYTLLGVYNTIASLLPRPAEGELPRRSHNKEAEILAEVILRQPVRHGDVSRIRKYQRRGYHR
jgi:hypothetical protein